MESECHQLDLELAQLTKGEMEDKEGFLVYSKKIHQICDLEERERIIKYADTLDSACTTVALQLGDAAQSSPLIHSLMQEAKCARDSVEDTVRPSLCSKIIYSVKKIYTCIFY